MTSEKLTNELQSLSKFQHRLFNGPEKNSALIKHKTQLKEFIHNLGWKSKLPVATALLLACITKYKKREEVIKQMKVLKPTLLSIGEKYTPQLLASLVITKEELSKVDNAYVLEGKTNEIAHEILLLINDQI